MYQIVPIAYFLNLYLGLVNKLMVMMEKESHSHMRDVKGVLLSVWKG